MRAGVPEGLGEVYRALGTVAANSNPSPLFSLPLAPPNSRGPLKKWEVPTTWFLVSLVGGGSGSMHSYSEPRLPHRENRPNDGLLGEEQLGGWSFLRTTCPLCDFGQVT